MPRVSYTGDGTTTEFMFNFPYFQNTDIVVTKNTDAATGYTIVGTSAGENADIPYSGGKVVFETAPTVSDSITIVRNLPLARITDYQPMLKIEPTTLNQDMNYMMEVLKDMKDQLGVFSTQYAEIIDKESTTLLLARIAAIAEDITTVSAQITALGDVSNIRSSITALDNRTTNLLDYVVESQSPTAQNNYSWYRKYKSGWVEQGGIATATEGWTVCNLPVTMMDTHYSAQVTVSVDSPSNYSTAVTEKGTTYIKISNYVESKKCDWRVAGFAATL